MYVGEELRESAHKPKYWDARLRVGSLDDSKVLGRQVLGFLDRKIILLLTSSAINPKVLLCSTATQERVS